MVAQRLAAVRAAADSGRAAIARQIRAGTESAARMSSAIAGGIELSRSGRLSVIFATLSLHASLIVSKVGMSVMGKNPLAVFTFTFT
jgi:hypothetical protein